MNETNSVQPIDNALPQETLPKPLIKAGWLRGLIFLIIMFVVTTVLGVAVVFALGKPIASMEDLMESLGTPTLTAVYGIILCVTMLLVFIFRTQVDRRSLVSLGFSFGKQDRRDLVAGLLWGIGVVTTVFLILLTSGQIRVVAFEFPMGQLAWGILLFVFVALQEEIVSRGYLLNNFMQSANKYLSLVLVSVLFALGHGTNPNVSTIGLANIVLAGLLLGIYYVHKQNLWFPIGLHFTWNLFQGYVLGSPVSGVGVDSIVRIEFAGNELLTGGDFGFEASLVTTLVTIAAILVIHFKYRAKKPDSAIEPVGPGMETDPT